MGSDYCLHLQAQCSRILSAEHIQKWTDLYGMKRKLRCHPSVFSALDDPKEGATIFHAYFGAVYTEHGSETVTEWLRNLLEWEEDAKPFVTYSPGVVSAGDYPPYKKPKSEDVFIRLPPGYSNMNQYMPSPPPPQSMTFLPSPAPGPSKFSNPLAPAQPNLPFLPLFNQAAAQRRVSVEYPAIFSGPPHAGHWDVQCVGKC